MLEGEDLKRFYTALSTTNFKLPDFPEMQRKTSISRRSFSCRGLYAFKETEFSEEAKSIIRRFGDVFNLTYTRFNDLKLAEANAINAQIEEQKLREEKKRSDSLLLNILPEEIANELKQFGKSYARKHDEVTILFADIKGFSTIAENLSAEELVNQLDECFRAFDHIVEKNGLEKIKTVGDAYVCACGLPKPVEDNAAKAVRAALDMMNFIKGFAITKTIQDLPAFEFRVGIHTGPVITGVVGLKKFTYDIWGDAVNMAARMEHTE
jgi:class 3 adenylate cyclase